MGTDTQERAPLPTEGETKRDASFRVFAGQIDPEERPVNTENALVAPRTSKQLLPRDAVAGILVHVEGALRNVVTTDANHVSETLRKPCIDSLEDFGASHCSEGRELARVHATIFGCRY